MHLLDKMKDWVVCEVPITKVIGTIGEGKPWTPAIKVNGGASAFYSIGVGKGE